jgi:hypothetical protein
MLEFDRDNLFEYAELQRPIIRKIRNVRSARFVVRYAVQRAPQAILIEFPVRDAAILFAPQELQRSEFFTAIQTGHGSLRRLLPVLFRIINTNKGIYSPNFVD